MLSDLRSFTRAFPWQGQPPRLTIQNLTALFLLAGLAGLSLLLYLWAFVLPYNLLEWYQQPWLTLARFSREFLDTGMAALDLAPGEMDLDRHIGMVTRTNGFLSPVCCRAIELFQEEISKGNFGLGVMYPD